MIRKSEIIWNTIGSVVYSFLNSIILLFCTRLNGTEIAGMFSISYATGCILNAIGDMGIRIFQVTDTNRKYSFNDYLFTRIFSILLMVILGIAFVTISEYTNEKLYICLILIAIRVVDNFSETFQSEFQLNSRLDLAGKALLYRNLVEIGIFIIFDLFTKNIYISFGMMFISSVIILLIYDLRLVKKFTKIDLKYEKKKVVEILKQCIPLGVSTLVSMYVINAVKYSIDRFGNNTMQTYFNILYMPTFAINLVSILVIKPFLKPFGEYWNKKEYNKFIKIILLILGVLMLCTLVVEVVCLFIGIPILNFIYGIDLTNYKIHLLILILSGLFYASSTVMFYALGTIRKQNSTTISYIITSIFAFIISNIMVSKYEMFGATIACTSIMVVLFIIMTIAFMLGYKKATKVKN